MCRICKERPKRNIYKNSLGEKYSTSDFRKTHKNFIRKNRQTNSARKRNS